MHTDICTQITNMHTDICTEILTIKTDTLFKFSGKTFTKFHEQTFTEPESRNFKFENHQYEDGILKT